MSSLIATVDELRKYIPVTVTVDLDQLKPFIENQAEKQRLKKNILGPLLYADLLADYLDDDIAENTPYWELLEKAQLWIANFALYRSIPTGLVNIGTAGINKTSSDNIKPLTPAEIDLLTDDCLHASDEALEDLLSFLEENVDLFPDWKEAPSYTLIKEAFISSALEFDAEYGINESRSTFLAMKPYMLEVQSIRIKNVLTAELYAKMVGEIEEEDFSEAELVILPWIKKAIAYLTVLKSIPHISLKITGEGIQVYTRPDRTNTKARSAANATSLSNLKDACQAEGEAYIEMIDAYLKENAEDFAEYPQTATPKDEHGNFKAVGTGNISLL